MDLVDRKSILAYVYIFIGGPVSWISRKQKSVTVEVNTYLDVVEQATDCTRPA